MRWSASGEAIAVLVNFSGVPIGPYRIGLPAAGRWDEILNTDAEEFGGSGVGNLGGVTAIDVPWAASAGVSGTHPAAAGRAVVEAAPLVQQIARQPASGP